MPTKPVLFSSQTLGTVFDLNWFVPFVQCNAESERKLWNREQDQEQRQKLKLLEKQILWEDIPWRTDKVWVWFRGKTSFLLVHFGRLSLPFHSCTVTLCSFPSLRFSTFLLFVFWLSSRQRTQSNSLITSTGLLVLRSLCNSFTNWIMLDKT